MHKAIHWSALNSFLKWKDDIDWIISSKKIGKIVQSKGLPPPIPEQNAPPNLGTMLLKCKSLYILHENKQSNIKRIKFDNTINPSDTVKHLDLLLGITWMNNSCAYNAIFIVIFNIWHENPASTGTL